MATNPTFSNPGFTARVRVAAANTASDGSGTINKFLLEDNVTDFSGNASGSRLEKITIINSQASAAASSANVVRVYLSDSSGSNWRLFKEVTIAAATRSTSLAGAVMEISLAGVDIGSGVKVGITQSVYAGVQDQMDYVLEGSNYN